MTNRERALAILNYEPCDRMPIVHFGYWRETVKKWADEGHVTAEDGRDWQDGNLVDDRVSQALGFDFNWIQFFQPIKGNRALVPGIEERIIEVYPDGSRKVLNGNGVTLIEKEGGGSIPTEIDHMLKGRKEWEEVFLPRLQFVEERISKAEVHTPGGTVRFDEGGRDYLLSEDRDLPYGLYCGSLYGFIRDWMGLEGACYLEMDDPDLLDEMIQTLGDLSCRCAEAAIQTGVRFDYGHFWEDICYRNGPLVSPRVFEGKVGPQYKRVTELLGRHGVKIVSVDCDGLIDRLIPGWLGNGVNAMLPMEVGTWHASIEPWRKEFGRDLRGLGGMDKRVFSMDYAAVDREVERLKPLVDLGGYLPFPDHRIPPDAKRENIQYYCERMRSAF